MSYDRNKYSELGTYIFYLGTVLTFTKYYLYFEN